MPLSFSSLPPTAEQIASSIESMPSEDIVTELDSLLAKIQANTRSLQVLRNSHTKIALLPEELLSSILVTSVSSSLDSLSAVSCRDHVQTTAVCSLWRTPAFWACIPLDSCHQLPQMII
ncbi:hypothetical protein BDV98DRAFT_566585 [Pterulicium gracile]|uniref:F-box domain-containing protein n=1 Tax=Pterulicium gracile TaxID=1884261 RepID=A0A5C3QL27_9AGAR|nr:hypothetical protein BDV98DRAFT_566585 [Pterula gracilis]